MRPYLSALRLKTLPAAVVPVVLAAAWVSRSGRELDWLLGLCTLGSALCIQIATNFFNDALDSDRGADGPDRIGPRRATASGELSRREVMWAGAWFIAGAALLALPLIRARGWPILAIGLPSIYLAYGYTGGALRLAYRGLGELFVMIFFGWIAVLGTVYVLGGELDAEAWALGTACGAFSSVLIAVNNLRDWEGDRRVGKMTLAARFGPVVGRLLVSLSLLLAYAALLYVEGMASLYLLPLLLAAFILLAVWRWPVSAKFNRLLGMAGLQLVLVALIFALRSA